MDGLEVEKRSSGQGWEGLRVIHIGDGHSASLGGNTKGGNLEKTQKKAFKSQRTSCLHQPASFTPSLMLAGISPTVFRRTFTLKAVVDC